MPYIDTIRKVKIQVNGQQVECIAASYKDVPFFFNSAEYSGGGRNVQSTRIPFSEYRINEDVGRNLSSYSFEIYFLGETCESDKDRFLNVCAETGAGELVHPYFGSLKVRCTDVSISYDNLQEYIKGSVSFVPEIDESFLSKNANTAAVVKSKSKELRNKVKSNYIRTIQVVKQNKSIIDKAVSMSYAAVDYVYSCRKILQKSYDFVRKVGKIKNNLLNILKAPADFAARIQELLELSSEVFGEWDNDNTKTNIRECANLMSFSPPSYFGKANGINSNATRDLVRMNAAATMCEACAQSNFKSTDEAKNFNDTIYNAFENALLDIEDSELYDVVQSLEASCLKYLREILSNLPYSVNIPIQATNNILSITYAIYGSLDNLNDVKERNNVSDPFFILPKSDFTVLKNA